MNATKRHAKLLSSLFIVLTAVLHPRAASAADPAILHIKDQTSMIHLGSLDSFDITKRGKEAAALLLDFVEKNDRAAAEKALAIYKEIIPGENFGGEYTTLQWFLECGLAGEQERKEKFLADPYTARFHRVLLANDAKNFRSFIRDKYHLPGGAKTKAEQNAKSINRFMEDLILFGNPHRELWEKSSKMIEALDLKPGESVADIGSGPGFFSFKFAKLVGPTGKVLAIDNNIDHINYLLEAIEELKAPNVEPVFVQSGGLGIKEKVDVVFACSVYHNLYTALSEEELVSFFDECRKALKPGGRLVIADNGPVSGDLPYHGPYIDRQLIISQFHHAGFDLVASHQFIPQRYMLTFKMRPGAATGLPEYRRPVIPEGGLIARSIKELPPTSQFAEFVDGSPDRIRVLTPRSLIPTFGAYPGFSKEARDVAAIMLAALEKKDAASFRAASEAFRANAPRERTGDEYTALGWFCDYQLATDAERKQMRADPAIAEFYDFFAANDFEKLKTYLTNKYLLGKFERHYRAIEKMLLRDSHGKNPPAPGGATPEPAADDTADEPQPIAKNGRWISPAYSKLKMDVSYDTLLGWIEYMAFSDPRRDTWEKTDKMISFLDIKPGEKIADVGSGGGYFTLRFSKLVGPKGRVYGLDTASEQVANLTRMAEKTGAKNVEAILSKENNTMLPDNSVDMAYLCSLYHATYVTSIEYVKDEFINSIRRALKPGGKLVIVENEPIPFEQHGFFGPRIAKELIIAQMLKYGFSFHSYAQFVPERYTLVFTVNKPPQ